MSCRSDAGRKGNETVLPEGPVNRANEESRSVKEVELSPYPSNIMSNDGSDVRRFLGSTIMKMSKSCIMFPSCA